MRTRSLLALLPLVLALACRDKAASEDDEDEDADTDTDADTDSGTDTDTDTDTDADSDSGGATALATGCLDDGCDFADVADAAFSACWTATGNAADTAVWWHEVRDGTSTSGVTLRCTSEALAEGDCAAVCANAGLDDPQFDPSTQSCGCFRSMSATGALADSQLGLACGDGTGAMSLTGQTDASGLGELMWAEIPCDVGTLEFGCIAAMDALGPELDVTFYRSSNNGLGCYLDGRW